MNGLRSNYPYGIVGTPTKISLNGSKVGPSVSPGYTGTVFEPIDAYKGDLARGQFYVATRYFGQDGSWPGSGSFDGAEMYPWAVTQYRAWSDADPVSWKERMRNGAAYVIQGNRNPFIDHPEFLTLIYDSTSVVGVGDGAVAAGWTLRLRANVPNPFQSQTTITFDLARPAPLRLGDQRRTVARTVAGQPFQRRGTGAEWQDAVADAGTPDVLLDQPRMALVAAPSTNQLAFEFVDGTNIRPGDTHMKRLVITFHDADHHDEAWTAQQGGREEPAMVFRYPRKK